jgi:hypothetical protein
MPASFSIHAPAAARCCDRSRETVACFVPTARFHARRSRPSVLARRAPLAAAAHSHHGKQYCPQHARLGAKHAHERACVVDSFNCRSCRPVRTCPVSNGYLDRCAGLDGSGMHSQCKEVRTHPLPLHRPLLSRDDRAGRCAWFWLRLRRYLRLGSLSRVHSPRKRYPVVGDRACLGQILLSQEVQVSFVHRLLAGRAFGRGGRRLLRRHIAFVVRMAIWVLALS